MFVDLIIVLFYWIVRFILGECDNQTVIKGDFFFCVFTKFPEKVCYRWAMKFLVQHAIVVGYVVYGESYDVSILNNDPVWDFMK